jgi:hypothetical protein
MFPPKHLSMYTRLHGITSQVTLVFWNFQTSTHHHSINYFKMHCPFHTKLHVHHLLKSLFFSLKWGVPEMSSEFFNNPVSSHIRTCRTQHFIFQCLGCCQNMKHLSSWPLREFLMYHQPDIQEMHQFWKVKNKFIEYKQKQPGYSCFPHQHCST